ncbi:hypothetical protein IWX90DRAFT_254741 [Phyllosticta citrichinensis]|uniref:Uncharacterized protein n=1 Tax=Phyllosticta citrichinensis TaxID=1130410 RepID=A0ABR1XRK7_9PEZI
MNSVTVWRHSPAICPCPYFTAATNSLTLTCRHRLNGPVVFHHLLRPVFAFPTAARIFRIAHHTRRAFVHHTSFSVVFFSGTLDTPQEAFSARPGNFGLAHSPPSLRCIRHASHKYRSTSPTSPSRFHHPTWLPKTRRAAERDDRCLRGRTSTTCRTRSSLLNSRPCAESPRACLSLLRMTTTLRRLSALILHWMLLHWKINSCAKKRRRTTMRRRVRSLRRSLRRLCPPASSTSPSTASVAPSPRATSPAPRWSSRTCRYPGTTTHRRRSQSCATRRPPSSPTRSSSRPWCPSPTASCSSPSCPAAAYSTSAPTPRARCGPTGTRCSPRPASAATSAGSSGSWRLRCRGSGPASGCAMACTRSASSTRPPTSSRRWIGRSGHRNWSLGTTSTTKSTRRRSNRKRKTRPQTTTTTTTRSASPAPTPTPPLPIATAAATASGATSTTRWTTPSSKPCCATRALPWRSCTSRAAAAAAAASSMNACSPIC